MRGYLIDPFKREITEVEYSGDYTEIYKLIDCETFTCVRINRAGDAIFLDDEGLINGKEQQFFSHDGYPEPLAGKGLVLGCNHKGDSVAPSTSIEELIYQTHWLLLIRTARGIAFVEM